MEEGDGKGPQPYGVSLGTGPVCDKVALRESEGRRTKGNVLGQALAGGSAGPIPDLVAVASPLAQSGRII